MARPNKQGLDYFPIDIDFFDDPKIELMSAKFGVKGEIITIKLLCKIYRNGYYLLWDDETSLMFAKRVGDGITYSLVNDVVQELVRRGFFDKTIFDSFRVLTSNGIQKRYFEATKKRKDVPKNTEFIVNSELMAVNSELTPVNSNINKQSKVKESKVKESKEESSSSSKKTIVLSQQEEDLPDLSIYNDDNALLKFTDFTFYDDDLQLKIQIEKMFKFFIKPDATISERTRVFQIITSSMYVSRKTGYSTALEAFQNYSFLAENKKNTAYLCKKIEGMLNDKLELRRKELAQKKKREELEATRAMFEPVADTPLEPEISSENGTEMGLNDIIENMSKRLSIA